ncbi:Hairy/enhancer-of-split with YRPW motif protein 2 [Entomophthora muscae]|uniref:Hairy/enhancer-of-split with YRPW motif protein 2 n=1 Tax=Entomophthora muscae TaxID=34485 RepID=A0ACC2RRL5_9FUNG|nr:Hairy/enhancer-of-split with YRPW motif protein 2 [Entomophthora muscae]
MNYRSSGTTYRGINLSIEDDLEDAKLWAKAQENLDDDIEYTYQSLTWLFSECLVYRDVHRIIQTRSEWKGYDPFRRQKKLASSPHFQDLLSL